MSTYEQLPHREQRTAYSAGGVIFRHNGTSLEVAMIATQRASRWGLPKGHVRRGETAEAAALREIAEETGLNGDVVRHLATIEYWFRAGTTRIHKYVDLFLVRYTDGALVPQETEVDDAQWFVLADALQRASFARERDVLELVQRLVEAGDVPR